MTRVIFLALLACLSWAHVFGQCEYGNCTPDELIQMDMEAANTDSSKSEVSEEKDLSPRQLLLGGYGGYGLGGYGLGYGGFGGYGGYGGGYGLGYGGLSSGLCTRSCFGVGCRLICRNRVFFDEDPEESQDSTDAVDSSDDELSEDEMNDLSMQDESDDTDAQHDSMVGSTKGDWKHAASCGNPSHGHSTGGRNIMNIIEASRSDRRPVSPKWPVNKPREITESNNAEIKELLKSGKRVFVMSHNVFKTLKPNDLLIRKKYVINPDGSKTWIRFQTVTRTSHTGLPNEIPSVINNEKNNESTISSTASLENSSLEKNHSSKEESRGTFFNPSSAMLDRFRPVPDTTGFRETLENPDREVEGVRAHGKRDKIEEMMRKIREEKRLRKILKELMRGRRGSSTRGGEVETSNVEGTRLPMENTEASTLSQKDILKMLMKMKKHHKRRPIVIVMDEDQQAQQDQEQQPEM